MLALHRTMNEMNTYVLQPAKSLNPIRDDYSALVMDLRFMSNVVTTPITVDTMNESALVIAATSAGIGGTYSEMEKHLIM